MSDLFYVFSFFFFNDTATTEIYTLSLHDALPIYDLHPAGRAAGPSAGRREDRGPGHQCGDRKSTRLNSSHLVISYAVFCLKKKKLISTIRWHSTRDLPVLHNVNLYITGDLSIRSG